MKPVSSILTLFVCVGALHCGDDAGEAVAPAAGGSAGAGAKAGAGGGTAGTGASAGASGKGGSAGASGKGGSAGAAGKGGSAGASGKGGASGAAGQSGSAGASGTAGSAGAAGAAGGAAGKAGAAGASAGAGGAAAGAGGSTAGAAGSTAGAAGSTAGQGGTDQGGQAGTDQGGQGGTDQGGQGGTDQGGQGGTDQGGQGGSDPGGAGGATAGAGGDSGAGGAVVAADYTISVEPGSVTVARGSAISVNVNIAKVGGFDDAVNISFEGLPAGVTASAGTIDPGNGTVSITLTADAAATLGSLAGIVVRGTSGSFDRTTTLTVQVNPAAATITSAKPVDAGADADLPYSDFRQGFTAVRIKIIGTGVAGIGTAGIRLGTIVPISVEDKGGYTIATFNIPHGEAIGTKDIFVTNVTGTGSFPAVVTVTAIAVNGGGNDATGRGTPASPFETIAKANTVSGDNDTIQLTGNVDTGKETYPIVLKPGTILEGVPSAMKVAPTVQPPAAGTCVIQVGASATIQKLRLSRCEVRKSGSGTLNVNDVLSHDTGAVGFAINEGEATFACTGAVDFCRIQEKQKGIVVAAGATLNGAPSFRGTANAEIAFEIAGTAALDKASVDGTTPLALSLTGSATVADTTFAGVGPLTQGNANAAIVVSGDGKLTATNLTVNFRRRGLLLTGNGSASLATSAWTGGGSNNEANRYFVRQEGASALKATGITATSNANETDFLLAVGGATAAIADSTLKGAGVGNHAFNGAATSAIAATFTGVTFSGYTGGAILADLDFVGTVGVGAGSSFVTSGTATIGTLRDLRIVASTAITVASGVTFGGVTVPAGNKTSATAPVPKPNNIPVWQIPAAGIITFQ